MAVTGNVGGSLPFGTGTNGLSLYVGGLQLGRRAWRRTTVESPFVSGEVETGAVLDQSHDTVLRFRCRGTSESAVKTLITSLVAAVEAVTWTLDVSVSGTAWPQMTCTRADTEVIFDTAHTRGFVATVFVYTTRNPNSSGPI
jgi:hypothetical protein